MTRDVTVSLLTLLLVGAAIVIPVVGATEVPAGVSDQTSGSSGGGGSSGGYGPPDGSVEFSCTEMRATVTPASWDFYLRLYYRDTATGDLVRGTVGPFSGTVRERFDGALVLVYVEIDVSNEIIATGSVPRHCYGLSGPNVDQKSNTRTNAIRTTDVNTSWTNEDASSPTVA